MLRACSSAAVRRVAMISMHTSPLAQAGQGDAGGMNVYVLNTAQELAAKNVQVEIFTRAVSSHEPAVCEAGDGVLVRHIMAGPFERLPKSQLPTQLCAFTAGVLRVGAARPPGYYDLVHSHYWLSGQVGFLAKDRWSVPLVHTAHTWAAVKNRHLAVGDRPEPQYRVIGEQQVIAEADRLIVNTQQECQEVLEEYDTSPEKIDIVAPGVNTRVFCPGSSRHARSQLKIMPGAFVIGFIGRIQPLKGFDVIIRALSALVAEHNFTPRQLQLVIVGGISGDSYNDEHIMRMIAHAQVSDYVQFIPAQPHDQLAHVYQACNVVVMPSHSESFGLVALEAQACGTPVIATRVGGLSIAVANGTSGYLLDNHDTHHWAQLIYRLYNHPQTLEQLSRGAVQHARQFSWSQTADLLLESYEQALYDNYSRNYCQNLA